MNLEEIKKYEDLKEEERKLSRLFASILSNKKVDYLINAVRTFRLYFKNNSFEVTSSSNAVYARYGDTKITLKYPDPKREFTNSVPSMEIYIDSLIKKNYKVPIETKYDDFAKENYFKAKKDSLHKGIEELTASVEKLKDNINNITRIQLAYGLIDEENLNKDSYEKYNKFDDILNSIFK